MTLLLLTFVALTVTLAVLLRQADHRAAAAAEQLRRAREAAKSAYRSGFADGYELAARVVMSELTETV